MSNPSTHQSATDNAAIEACAAAWLRRQEFSEWNTENQSELETWLAASSNHKAAYWRLKAAWDRTERLTVLRQTSSQSAARKVTTPLWGPAMKAFAVVACAVVLSVGALLLRPTLQVYTTVVGGHTSFLLADGTRVDLNTDTVIRADINTHHRTIEISRGEAYFEVKHDAARPFVVTSGNHRIVDLGTKFSVRVDSNEDLRVALTQGRAQLENIRAGAISSPAVLVPGDVAVATADSIHVARKPVAVLAAQLAWRSGALIFHGTSLGEAAAEFNRYNDTKLIVADANTRHLTINGTFRTKGIVQFARVTRAVFGLHVVELQNGNFVISN